MGRGKCGGDVLGNEGYVLPHQNPGRNPVIPEEGREGGREGTGARNVKVWWKNKNQNQSYN